MHKLGVYDLETTGLDPKECRITEIAFKYYDFKKGEKDVFHKYVKYDSYPDDYDHVARLTGNTPELLAEKGITEKEMYNEFHKFLGDKVDRYDKTDKIITAGYNITSFDDNVLDQLFLRYCNNYYRSFISFLKIEVASIMALASILEITPQLKNDKLETYKEHFKIDAKSHSAIEDVGTTEKLFYKMMVEIFVNFKSDEKRLRKIIE
jgi:DNA polymerase-3 subunit epsilon